MAAEAQTQPSAALDQARCQIHQFLDDRLDPPSFGSMPHRGLVSEKPQEEPKEEPKGSGF